MYGVDTVIKKQLFRQKLVFRNQFMIWKLINPPASHVLLHTLYTSLVHHKAGAKIRQSPPLRGATFLGFLYSNCTRILNSYSAKLPRFYNKEFNKKSVNRFLDQRPRSFE